MKRSIQILGILLCLVLATSASLQAQSTQTVYLSARLSTDNENPAITGLNALGSVQLKITVNRDAGGAVTSGTVVFDAIYDFPGAVTLTGFHIHNGAVGVNGPVVINSGLASTDSPTGKGSLNFTTPSLTSATEMEALDGLTKTPYLYYVNLHTSDHPAGVIRGQLASETRFYRANLLPANETPAITDLNASAPVLVALDLTRDSTGQITSGSIMFDANYSFPGAVTITGFHIHKGLPGVAGPVVINSNTTSFTEPSGSGRLVRVLDLTTDATVLSTLQDLVANPQSFYVNLHTPEHPGGAVRGQLVDANQYTSLPYAVDNSDTRSNLGIQNLTDMPGLVFAQLSDSGGDSYQKAVYLPARGFVQILGVNHTFGSDEEAGSVWLTTNVHVEAFVSVIQNSNNAPTVVGLSPVGTRLSIASATNVGSFQSSLVVANAGSGQAVVDVISRGTTGNIVGQKTGITIEHGSFYVDKNILATLGITSFGPLEIRSTNGQPVSAVSIVSSTTGKFGFSFAGKEF
jgi:hypothetical protein